MTDPQDRKDFLRLLEAALPIAGSHAIYRERVCCYELYPSSVSEGGEPISSWATDIDAIAEFLCGNTAG